MNKLIIYGDSILRGVTYSDTLKKYQLCKGYKLPTLTEMGLTVINRSRMGATVTRGLEILKDTVSECDENTTVLLEYGGNDCDFDWEAVSQNPSGSFLPHTPEETFIDCYRSAVQAAKASGAKVLLSTLPPIDAGRYLSWISNNRSYENILKWLGDVSMLYRFQEHYNGIVEDIARREGCELLNVRKEFLLSHAYASLISEDGIHPTEEGHDLIERVLRNRLQADALTV